MHHRKYLHSILNSHIKYMPGPFIKLSMILFFILFANDLICGLIGLFFPFYIHISTKNKIISTNVLKYYIIYAHIDLLFNMLSIFGIYFYRIKLIIILISIYQLRYQATEINTPINNLSKKLVTIDLSIFYFIMTHIKKQMELFDNKLS